VFHLGDYQITIIEGCGVEFITSASDRNTGKTESITTVTMSLDLLGDEVDRMIHIGLKENNIWKKK
jgi:hypothetical protein